MAVLLDGHANTRASNHARGGHRHDGRRDQPAAPAAAIGRAPARGEQVRRRIGGDLLLQHVGRNGGQQRRQRRSDRTDSAHVSQTSR